MGDSAAVISGPTLLDSATARADLGQRDGVHSRHPVGMLLHPASAPQRASTGFTASSSAAAAPVPTPIWTVEERQAWAYIWDKMHRVSTSQIPKDYFNKRLERVSHGWLGLPEVSFNLDSTSPSYLALKHPIVPETQVIRSAPHPNYVSKAVYEAWLRSFRYDMASRNTVEKRYRQAALDLARFSTLQSAFEQVDHASDPAGVRQELTNVWYGVLEIAVADMARRLHDASSLLRDIRALLPSIFQHRWNHQTAILRLQGRAAQEGTRLTQRITVTFAQSAVFWKRAVFHRNFDTDRTLQVSDLCQAANVSNVFTRQKGVKTQAMSSKFASDIILAAMHALLTKAATRADPPVVTVQLARSCLDAAIRRLMIDYRMEVFPNILPAAGWRDVHRRFVVFEDEDADQPEISRIHRDERVLAIIAQARTYWAQMSRQADKDKEHPVAVRSRVRDALLTLSREDCFSLAVPQHRTIVYAVLYHSAVTSQGRLSWLTDDPRVGGLVLADLGCLLLCSHGHGDD